ncbi:MAG TPA: YqhA family protein [Beijerinckiaceae bacterium]
MRLAKARRTELRLPSSRSLAASLTLIAAAGALISALLMVWEGGVKLAGALRTLLACGEEAKSVVGSVMGATNAFLFGVVLLVFAIAFGFVFDLTVTTRERFPEWMRIGKIGELKRTLIEVSWSLSQSTSQPMSPRATVTCRGRRWSSRSRSPWSRWRFGE